MTEGAATLEARWADTFIFENYLSANGLDRITDLDVISDGKDSYGSKLGSSALYDKLDISAVLGKTSRIESDHIKEYVKIASTGAGSAKYLQLDRDGGGSQYGWESYASLSKFSAPYNSQPGSAPLAVGDQVFVYATGAYSGFVTVS